MVKSIYTRVDGLEREVSCLKKSIKEKDLHYVKSINQKINEIFESLQTQIDSIRKGDK
jgi:flagellin-specific chaperone FliS